MLAGRQKLLRVDASIHIPGQTSKQTTWIDGSGEILKLDVPVFGFVIYRTTKEIALLPSESGGFDLGKMSMVKIERTLPDPHATRRITYRARVKDGSLDGVFTTGLSQSVKQLADKSVEVTVRAVRPDQPAEIDVPVDQPTDDDLQPNSLIQSDDERVMRLARDVVANSTNAWTIARELERHVNSKLKDVNFSQAFATAAEVAETLEGDCTEHAVLLAALCRARNIPARVAIGLVYFRGKSGEGFGYHMWTEVWITDRWVPLDATLGRGGIGAAHLKIAHSSLKGADAYSAFLPVIPVIGRLELEIVDVE